MNTTAAVPQGTERNLLLVDDDYLMPALLSKTTSDSGYLMKSTTKPSKLSSMDLEKFDVIILDLMMPEFDGIDVIAQLANTKYQGGLILISGLGDECLQSAAKMANTFQLDCLGALPKPIKAADLKPLLTDHLFKLFNDSWQHQQPDTADPNQLVDAIKGNLIQLEAKPLVTAAESVVIGGELIASWERDNQSFDHSALCRSAALDGTATKELSLFLLREAFRSLNQSTPNRMEVSIRLPGAAMKDEKCIETIRTANLAQGTLSISFDANDVVELRDFLPSQCLRLAKYGIKFAIDVESKELLQNLDYIRAPFSRVVITKPHILHGGYEKVLNKLFDHAKCHTIETVVSDIDSLENLQKARSAGFTHVRPLPLKVKTKPNPKSHS